jgi:hypothetical protein
MNAFGKRSAILLTLLLCTAPAWTGPGGSTDKKLTDFDGNVVPLAELLAKQGNKMDADAAAAWLVLVTKDGKTYPLLKDAGSRMFFKDAQLLKRPMRLTGRLLPGSEILQVINVHSLKDGKLHDVYYWCDICTIKGFEAGICDCCGGPMEFREVPVK